MLMNTDPLAYARGSETATRSGAAIVRERVNALGLHQLADVKDEIRRDARHTVVVRH